MFFLVLTSLPVLPLIQLPHFRAAAFVPLGPLEDSIPHNADVQEALAWATAVWDQQSTVCLSLEEFMVEVRKVFDFPLSGREPARKLLRLLQDSFSVAAWNLEALFDTFLNGLPEEITDELAAREPVLICAVS